MSWFALMWLCLWQLSEVTDTLETAQMDLAQTAVKSSSLSPVLTYNWPSNLLSLPTNGLLVLSSAIPLYSSCSSEPCHLHTCLPFFSWPPVYSPSAFLPHYYENDLCKMQSWSNYFSFPKLLKTAHGIPTDCKIKSLLLNMAIMVWHCQSLQPHL